MTKGAGTESPAQSLLMVPVDSLQIGGDLTVSRLGFGAMGLVGPDVYGPPADPANPLAVLRRAVELGVNFIDTAEAYGPEINGRQIAEALGPYPANLVIATKCGTDRRARDWAQTRTNGSRAEIRASCEGSLRRLWVERIDLYQLHRLDPSPPGLPEDIETLNLGFDEVGYLDSIRVASEILSERQGSNRV